MAVGREIKFLERMFKSKLGSRVRQFLILDKKIVAKRWKSIANAALERQVVRAPDVLLVAAEIARASAFLRKKLLDRFVWLNKFSDQSFAEVCATVLTRGRRSEFAIRGLLVERFIPDMAEMESLFLDLKKAVKLAEKDWGAPTLLSGLRTKNGRQIADWVVCSVHKDGRIWVMALVESKSISNMEELIEKEGRGAGQFMWDYLRAKGEGLVIDVVDAQGNVAPRVFDAAKVVLEPIVSGATKMPKYPTRLIGVIPAKFTARQRLNIASAGLKIEEWKWPVSQSEVLKLIAAIKENFS
jgi:hypothetical protein